jgi:hypothetical protein
MTITRFVFDKQQNVIDQVVYIARGKSLLDQTEREKALARAILLLLAANGNTAVLRAIAEDTLWE